MTVKERRATTEGSLLRLPAVPYVAPFVVFLALLGTDRYLPFGAATISVLRFALVFAVLVWLSRGVISLRSSHLFGSVLLGVAVFGIWVGPDVLWPGYRQSWLFNNGIVGAPRSTQPPDAKTNLTYIVFRIVTSTVNVPILEELFWRAWLMRFLIAKDFREVPPGAYTAQSFWTVAVLFASEHGPYWDVGLIAGVLYNWWMVRTGSLGDCIVAHAVTNACLAGYVLACDHWQYWL